MQDTLLMLSLIAAVFAVPACADDIGPSDSPPEGVVDLVDAAPGAKVATSRDGETYLTRIDSTSPDAWVYLDLETGAEVDASARWDLATQRFHIQLNGGVSGSGGVEVAPLRDVALDAVTTAPAEGWITDAADGADDNTLPDLAFEQGDGWYQYSVTTHVLTPWPMVWVVRTTEGTAVKIAIESYYDDAGTSGYLRLRWAPLGGGS